MKLNTEYRDIDRHRRITDHGDDDLTFFVLAYRDYAAACECLRDLRHHYPRSRVILRTDGDSDPRFLSLTEAHRIELHQERRLFGVENGGRVIERMLELYSERPTPFLFKIDPDTVIHRRLRYLPARCGLFGTPQGGEQTPSIQGGCLGFSRRTAGRILASGMLRDRRLTQPQLFVDDSPYFGRMARRAKRSGLASFDWGLAWIAEELGIPLFGFDEVNSGWRQPPPNPGLRFAVTHPRTPRDPQDDLRWQMAE